MNTEAMLASFLDDWKSDPNRAKVAFMQYKELLSVPNVSFHWKARPGVSYSLRAQHSAQKNRDLFVLIDVIDDEPENRWLSVCFYADMVTDPKELADFVPNGLLGEDARCFNLEDDDENMKAYIADRLQEALAYAKS
ncbi:MAG: hypothetical protein J5803_04220 [Desulfovibrio sp.]|nr:hypothetical protein [Desulfovibrio sp.]